MDAVHRRSTQSAIVNKMVVKPPDVRFLDLMQLQRAEIRAYKFIVHILVVPHRVILEASFDTAPKVKQLVKGDILIRSETVRNILFDPFFLFTKLVKRLSIDALALSVNIGPSVNISAVGAFSLSFAKNDPVAVYSEKLRRWRRCQALRRGSSP